MSSLSARQHPPAYQVEPLPAPPPVGTVAVFVTHGMGQQIPFQTLDQVADGLWRAAGKPNAKPVARVVRHETEELRRLELQLEGPLGRPMDVHVYESYWAPLTERKITLRDVMRFLAGAGWNGVRNAWRGKFDRWLFGGMMEFPIATRTLLSLLMALAVIGALVVLNAAIGVAVAGALLGERARWLTDGLLGDLTTTFNAVVLAMAVAGVCLALGATVGRRLMPAIRTAWSGITSIVLLATVAVVLIAGVAIPALFYAHVRGGTSPGTRIWHRVFGAGTQTFDTTVGTAAAVVVVGAIALALAWWTVAVAAGIWRDMRKPRDPRSLAAAAVFLFLVGGCAWILVRLLPAMGTSAGVGIEALRGGELVWVLLVAASAYIRKVLVQYVGDVAIYIMPYGVDAFNDLRARIRECSYTVGRAIYDIRDATGTHAYSDVVVVGHSLGSVIAYDVLNQLVREENTGSKGSAPNVASRTSMLLTFGSPLDKTAFIFGMQKQQTSAAREALAAAVQPLIQDYGFRPRRWINVHSPWDIISGPLDFYDPPGSTHPRRVFDVVDADAATPLIAHTEYWRTGAVWRVVVEHLKDPPAATEKWGVPPIPALRTGART